MMTWFHGLWRALVANPILPIAAYLAVLGIGGVVTRRGIVPDTLRTALPLWLVESWTAAVAVGGILTVVGGLLMRTRIESAGLGLLAWGAVMYGAVVAFEAWPSGATVIAVGAAVASMCLIRMRILTLARRAQERVGEIDRGEF